MRLPMAFEVSIAPRAARLLIVYLMDAFLRNFLSAPATQITMKRTLSSSVHGVFAKSDNYADKKQRTTQESGPATTEMLATAENQTTETMTRETMPATSDNAGYASDSPQSYSNDDSSISDSLQWPSDDDHDDINDEEGLLDKDQQSYLCTRCRQIDFAEILSRGRVADGGDPILAFSDEQRVLHDPKCAFCQAMHFIYPSLDDWSLSWKQSSPLVVANVNDITGTQRKDHAPKKGSTICLTFAKTFPRRRTEIHRWTRDQIRVTSLDRDRDLVGYLAEEQTISSDYEAVPAASVKAHVDFGLIKRKLDECRASHSRCRDKRHSGVTRVPGMRLIDCITGTVVPAPTRGCTYAALSYVWGTLKSTSESTAVSCNRHEDLPADLPRTIAEAMFVTLRLKIRYLWCDRYCIRQNPATEEEKNEKHGQIARMSDIYGGASITIIAAAGDGPGYGLPGVRSKRQPPRVRIGSRTLLATLPDPKILIDHSVWSSRGWTFQEGLLARRRLVFTDQQVYFQCGEIGSFEAFDKSGEMSKSFDPDMGMDTPVYPYFSMATDGMPEIWARIDSYVELTLGNPQDILNAFLGISKHYEEVLFPNRNVDARNVAGLLIHTRINIPRTPRSWPFALGDALAWLCDEPGERRNGFPSWSWIGWYCKGLVRNQGKATLLESRTKSLSISVEGTNNVLLEQGDLHKLIESRHDLSGASSLRITAPSLETRVVHLETAYPDADRPPIPSSSSGRKSTPHYLNPRDFDNTEKRVTIQYIGFEYGAFINLSNALLCNGSLPSKDAQCFAIVLDEDHSDVADDELGMGENEYGSEFIIYYATTLIVVETEGGFERIGVSCVDREELRQVGSTVREFRLV